MLLRTGANKKASLKDSSDGLRPERKRRKDFIIERNLLYPNPLEKELSSEDKEVYERFKVFMRFLSPEDHANFLRNLVEERKLRNRIQDLQVRITSFLLSSL